jgi:hypothetical protein
MPTRQTFQNISAPAFVVDRNAMVRDTGRQIDWAAVPEKYHRVPGGTVTLTANAAADAVALAVAALTIPIAAYTALFFGASK